MTNSYWDKPLTHETAKLYAATKYDGVKTWSAFFNDMKGFSSLSRQLVRWNNDIKADIHFCLNQTIYLGNLFPEASLARLIFTFAKQETYPIVKSILKAIYRLPLQIPEVDLGEIISSERANDQIRKILKN